ncbi:MAG: acetoin utilization protein AcuC [Thermoplasmata archaeon]|nr:acetoin utilization protein AcuC [Thermoplasmata archaeon]
MAVRLLATLLAPADRRGIEIRDDLPVAPREYLETFHDPVYVERVRLASGGARRQPLDGGDTPSFKGCYEAASRIASGAAWAVGTAIESQHPTFHPAGGLHHAHPDRASGFCIFNDLALAIGDATRSGQKVAYLDIDAHHGDGVMYGFYDSGQVLDIDFHQDGRTLFPGTGFPKESGSGDGAGLKVNVPLPPGAGDEALLPLFRRLVPPLLRAFRPDVIVLQHGADGHAGDPLTALNYTSRSYDQIDRLVLAMGRELCHSRVVFTGGGGYRPEAVARVLARAGAFALGLEVPAHEAPLPPAWRSEFEKEWGRPAPETWVDPLPPSRAVPQTGWMTGVVGELEKVLGVSLPPVGPA